MLWSALQTSWGRRPFCPPQVAARAPVAVQQLAWAACSPSRRTAEPCAGCSRTTVRPRWERFRVTRTITRPLSLVMTLPDGAVDDETSPQLWPRGRGRRPDRRHGHGRCVPHQAGPKRVLRRSCSEFYAEKPLRLPCVVINTPDEREAPRSMDPRSLRALAHPTRVAILDLVTLDGPTTSTRLARRMGQNTGTVSWHLRHLAEHGYIEEDIERGTKRERWWRRSNASYSFVAADFRHDPHSRQAFALLVAELVNRHFARVASYVEEDWDDTWRSAGAIADWTDLRMSPAQLRSLTAELAAVVARHEQATADEPPGGDALPVVVQVQAFPRSIP